MICDRYYAYRYDIIGACENGIKYHPQAFMGLNFGEFALSESHPIADCWIFFYDEPLDISKFTFLKEIER